MMTSLDGYVADVNADLRLDRTGHLEVWTFLVNDLERNVGTNLYGRRMCETMVYWETFDEPGGRIVHH